ncbi:MAG: hypothetical protein A2086_16630 [Spirochaetes bacterium GWD1_27_9]|nr:MAG: hypothetical protein A2086_16630 [Spirochaetes bacterium GWD1_27_9]
MQNESNLIFRPFKPDDFNQVYELHKNTMMALGVYTGKDEDDLDDIQNYYFNNRGFFLIAELNYKIIAMGAFKNIDNDVAEIKRMRTNSKYQGKGIGALLLKKLIEKAIELGYKKLILETSDKQIAAHKLYKKFGFVEYKKEIINGFNCSFFYISI